MEDSLTNIESTFRRLFFQNSRSSSSGHFQQSSSEFSFNEKIIYWWLHQRIEDWFSSWSIKIHSISHFWWGYVIYIVSFLAHFRQRLGSGFLIIKKKRKHEFSDRLNSFAILSSFAFISRWSRWSSSSGRDHGSRGIYRAKFSEKVLAYALSRLRLLATYMVGCHAYLTFAHHLNSFGSQPCGKSRSIGKWLWRHQPCPGGP